jgi:cell division protein FtsW
VLGLLWVVGAPAKLFAGALAVAGTAAFYLAATDAERRDRLTSFADPFKDFGDAGWQAAHGIFAMSTGGIFGKGIGASQQKWGDLPAAHTDFIFAVLGEELGMVGTLLVLGLFLTIAYAGVRVAIRTQDPFVRYMSAGITVWLMVQMMVNIGMVLALLPVIGIPLPLVSYGGSALLPSLVALGLLISFARSEPGAKAALQARERRRPAGITGGGWGRRR